MGKEQPRVGIGTREKESLAAGRTGSITAPKVAGPQPGEDPTKGHRGGIPIG